MSAAKTSRAECSEANTILSPEAQKDLEDALDETLSPQKAWVEENRRDLLTAFANGRQVDPTPQKNVDTFNAVEGSEKDLRHALVSILLLARFSILGVTRADACRRTLYTKDMAL